jgi:hypothetical protein
MRKNTLSRSDVREFGKLSENTLIMSVCKLAVIGFPLEKITPFARSERRARGWVLISFGQKVICIFIVPSCLLLSFIFPASGVLKKELPHNEMLIRTRPTAGFCNTTNCRRSRQARSRTWSPSNDCEYNLWLFVIQISQHFKRRDNKHKL